MSDVAEYYQGRKEANQRHRWSQYETNEKHAKNAGAEFDDKGSTWIFELPDGVKVHFYPTKNWWRFAAHHKTMSYEGGFKKFWKWFRYQEEQRRHTA